MELILTKFWARNYKNLTNFECELFGKTMISGFNRVGKTTIMDAVFDICTNKMSDGSAADNIRPHDENGNEIDRLEIVRGVTCIIDGKETSIEKTTRQKWVRKSGADTEVFEGNETLYKVDGFDMKPTAFKKWFAENIGSEETFLLCMNAQPFINSVKKSTADGRKKLEELSGFNLNDFIDSHEEYREIADITKGNHIETALKQFRTDLKKQKDELTRTNTNLSYEASRSVGEDISDFELMKNALNESRSNLLSMLDVNSKKEEANKEKQDEIIKLKFDQNTVALNLNSAHANAKSSLDKQIMEKKVEVERTKAQLNSVNAKIFSLESDENRLEKKLDELLASLKEVESKEFASPISNNVCSYSGSECEHIAKAKEREVEKAKEVFEKNKNFNIGRLDECIAEAKASMLDDITAKQRELEAKTILENRINFIDKEIGKMLEQYDSIPEEIDFNADSQFKALSEKIAKLESEIDGNVARRKQELNDEIIVIDKQIRDIDAKILSNRTVIENHDKDVIALKLKIKEQAMACADYERKIALLENFSIKKNEAIANIINPHFRHIQFEFTDRTQDGNIFETLKIMVAGTNYFNGLNGGDKRLAELDICRGLQELNGYSLPIFVDEAATIDPNRIPEVEQQIILLQRADNKLKVVDING